MKTIERVEERGAREERREEKREREAREREARARATLIIMPYSFHVKRNKRNNKDKKLSTIKLNYYLVLSFIMLML